MGPLAGKRQKHPEPEPKPGLRQDETDYEWGCGASFEACLRPAESWRAVEYDAAVDLDSEAEPVSTVLLADSSQSRR